MTNEERNTALYQKMSAEQETYRKWLLSQPPEEILHHTYEYTVREDVLMSLENRNLTDAQADALLKSPCPLEDVFREFEKRETDYMARGNSRDMNRLMSMLPFRSVSFSGLDDRKVGDLAASAIKRNKEIKDYGRLIPGHGGILDRFDSVIFTAPFIYFLANVLL